jgi:hypothetical protein
MPRQSTYGQIAIYPDEVLRKKVETEACERRRKLGPTVVEILLEYFAKKETGHDLLRQPVRARRLSRHARGSKPARA